MPKAQIVKPKKKGVPKKLIAAAVLAVVAAIILAPKIKKALPKNVQKKINKLGKDISSRAAKVGQLTKEKYEEVVDVVAKSYKRSKQISEEELKVIVPELKKYWAKIQKKIK